MGNVLMSLCGAMIFSIIADFFLIEGSLKKFTKLAIGIAVAIIILSPVLSILKIENIDLEDYVYTSGYTSVIEKQFSAVYSSAVIKELEDRGIPFENVEVFITNEDVSEIVIFSNEINSEEAYEIGKMINENFGVGFDKIKIKIK